MVCVWEIEYDSGSFEINIDKLFQVKILIIYNQDYPRALKCMFGPALSVISHLTSGLSVWTM